MNRIKDYANFAAWFAGLGYIALWPVTSPELGGKPFGAAAFCRDGAFSLLDLLCASARPLQLAPGLHALGFLSALFVTIRLLVYAIRRPRRVAGRATLRAVTRLETLSPAPPPPRCKPAPPPHTLTRRSHFGLRGLPQCDPAGEKYGISSATSDWTSGAQS
jgi:hypothetical protein